MAGCVAAWYITCGYISAITAEAARSFLTCVDANGPRCTQGRKSGSAPPAGAVAHLAHVEVLVFLKPAHVVQDVDTASGFGIRSGQKVACIYIYIYMFFFVVSCMNVYICELWVP